MLPQCTLKSLALFIILLVSTTRLLANSEAEYRQSIDQIGGQIKEISRNLNANEKLLKTEQDQLFETEKKLTGLSKEIKTINQSIKENQNKIKNLEEDIEKNRESQTGNREAFQALLEYRYKQGKQDYLKQFLNQENPYAVGRLNNYHEYFFQALRARFAELEKQINLTQKIHENHQRTIAELVYSREKQKRLQGEWQAVQQKRSKSVAKLTGKVGASKEKLDQLKKDRQRLNNLLKKIAQQAAELRRIEKEREEQERLARERKRVENKEAREPVAREPVKGGFLKQKGRLSFPVAASPKTKFGSRLPASGMKSEGMFFDTPKSVSVKSVFRGRILFADFLKGYGLLIIVDHGDDHISLYGHNELLYKRVGDTVETGEVIAKTGVTGGLKSAGLYFEIRQNTNPVNPALWCR